MPNALHVPNMWSCRLPAPTCYVQTCNLSRRAQLAFPNELTRFKAIFEIAIKLWSRMPELGSWWVVWEKIRRNWHAFWTRHIQKSTFLHMLTENTEHQWPTPTYLSLAEISPKIQCVAPWLRLRFSTQDSRLRAHSKACRWLSKKCKNRIMSINEHRRIPQTWARSLLFHFDAWVSCTDQDENNEPPCATGHKTFSDTRIA